MGEKMRAGLFLFQMVVVVAALVIVSVGVYRRDVKIAELKQRIAELEARP